MSEREFDVVVIGAGPAGEVAAGRLGAGGLSVALVERELVGGECSYWACMPSKALLRPAQALDEARRVGGAAQAVTGGPDAAGTLARRDEVVHGLDDSGQIGWLDDRNVTLVRGHGRLDGERRVRVEGDGVLVARRAVIVATGSAASIPPVPGLAESRPWTNRHATVAREIPARLTVLGGGVAGVELAQAFATLGSSVTLVETEDRLLAKEEEFVSEQVADGLRAKGVTIHVATKAAGAERDGEHGAFRLATDTAGTIESDQLLVAAGRRPVTADLGLDSVGLEPGEAIEVDDTLRSPGREWLYALGDVNGRAPLTHMGKYQARVACDRILGDEDARLAPLTTAAPPPRVVFTEPQVAATGHTLASAREAGIDARAVDTETSANAGSSFHGRNAPGTCRLIVDDARGVVAGATFTGVDVQEMLHAATVAIAGEVPLTTLAAAIPAFPTRNEIWLSLLEDALA